MASSVEIVDCARIELMIPAPKITEYKAKLEDEKATLEEELAKLGKRNPANQDDWIPAKPEGEEFGADMSDNADIIDDEETNNATLNELEGRLNQVTLALEKIGTEKFGVCEVSGQDIEIARLDANPAARTCKMHMASEATLG